ncbi:LOW QUALITY PROTEIN: zinc finger protein 431-like [Anastrepha ludens]|uniref:LOW QUALITY PROTEIN: zinc finger protein 431-like n=1 Tax=Anastrepha ludens TaxID=28586 RepID=UPI0023B080DE|nr:LOW QUALITY PROTEIN: zinc finger protein 431-like [Anastrepha ludens]
MNQLSRNNMQEFCRTCLRSLQKRRRQERETTPTNLELLTTFGNDSDSIKSYNLSLLPQLRKLFVLFTSLDISEGGDEDAYPRSLCQLCYDKMIDFQEFRQLAINSAEVLYKIVNSLDDDTIKSTEETANLQPNENHQLLESGYQNRDDDDDQLLLAELADLMETSIKTEQSIDINRSNAPSSEILPNIDISKNPFTAVVKNEIESECDEEENNALGTAHNSISDDADDEEHTLRNETNTSRRLRKNVSSTVGVRQRFCGQPRKRGRSKKALKCPRCDKQVYKQVYLDAHIRAIHEGYEKPFLCTQCEKAFTRYVQLHTHIESQHISEDIFSCDFNGCDAVFKSKNTWETRRQVVHTKMLEFHNAPSTVGVRQRFCGQPRKRDRSKKALKCPRCDKQVYKQVYLDAHIRAIHEGYEKPFLCTQCEKAFTRYGQLHMHIESQHLSEENFSCDFNGCDAVFKSKNTWETHRQMVHTKMLEFHNTQLGNEIGTDHICHQCFKKYSSKRALTEHLKRHAQIKDHVCKECGAAKVTRTELLTHMRTHKPNLEKFKCSICPQKFNHKNAISRHVRVVHEGQRRFPCSYCPKRFGTRNSQVCHERVHTGERPFNCKLCNKRYAKLDGLKSHMKSHDKNLRKYVCSFCSQRFITRKNLIDHEKRHRSDKPHCICNACSQGFFSKEDLRVHKRTHTDEELREKTEPRRRYETFQEAGDSLGEQATESAGEGILGYSSSQSSN